MAKKTNDAGGPITIKKYANRRLYNTATSSYVTLENLAQMVRDGQDFVVNDAKSGEDLTRSVLTQIIFEQEQKGQNLLPIPFLRQLITFYDDSLQGFLPSYLEMSMESFSQEREKLRERMVGAFGGKERFEQFEGQIRKNLSMFEEAVRMFSPFALRSDAKREEKEEAEAAPEADKPEPADAADLNAMKEQLAAIQAQLNALTSEKDEK